jgi:hypothetical protein
MKIYPGENTPGQVSSNRLRDRSLASGDAPIRGGENAQPVENPVPQIRKQILVVQRSLGRQQSILGGLEGIEHLFGSPTSAGEIAHYIGGVVYRGEAVLDPFSAELSKILQRQDRSALRTLIKKAKEEIQALAAQLSRLETAEQNSRSLNPSSDALADTLAGIRSQGDQLLKLEGKNVLDLLS